MKLLLAVLILGVLFALCWPLAVAVLVLLPLFWLLSLPFRLLFYAGEAVLALLRAFLLLPARLLGAKR